ncbi:putative Carbohydrate phosphorylase [Prochlorococcus sp. MIT 0702]|nr:putative Carbohydrate phosphorylase [Prochlorococcus sp. MIT 0702]KGG33548.1 putative Carbohydrate phosphorylase [Prochlorococcus sp. MIT 0703]
MSETNSLLHKRLRNRAIKRRILRAFALTSFILIVAAEIATNADGRVVFGAFLGIALYHFSIELENLKDSE